MNCLAFASYIFQRLSNFAHFVCCYQIKLSYPDPVSIPMMGIMRSQEGNDGFPAWEWLIPFVGTIQSVLPVAFIVYRCKYTTIFSHFVFSVGNHQKRSLFCRFQPHFRQKTSQHHQKHHHAKPSHHRRLRPIGDVCDVFFEQKFTW